MSIFMACRALQPCHVQSCIRGKHKRAVSLSTSTLRASYTVRAASGCPFHQSGQGRPPKPGSDTPIWASARVFVLPVAKVWWGASGCLCLITRFERLWIQILYLSPQWLPDRHL